MSSYVCIVHGLSCEDGECDLCVEEVIQQMEEGDPRDSVKDTDAQLDLIK